MGQVWYLNEFQKKIREYCKNPVYQIHGTSGVFIEVLKENKRVLQKKKEKRRENKRESCRNSMNTIYGSTVVFTRILKENKRVFIEI